MTEKEIIKMAVEIAESTLEHDFYTDVELISLGIKAMLYRIEPPTADDPMPEGREEIRKRLKDNL